MNFVYVSASPLCLHPVLSPPEGQLVMAVNPACYFRRTLALGLGGRYGDQLFFQQANEIWSQTNFACVCFYTLKSNSSFVFYAKDIFPNQETNSK